MVPAREEGEEMGEHTPGPWRRGIGEIDYGAVVADASPRAPSEYDAREVEAYGGYIIAESIAPCNIPLICAAPDLLAACELARDLFWNRMALLDSQSMDVYRAVLIAIAKAKGPA